MRCISVIFRNVRRLREERGNIIVTTAVMMTVLMGMLVLAIDVGSLAGQRRFMQNGADSAALGVARQLTNWIGPSPAGNTFPTQFNFTNGSTRTTALDLATKNQNPGLVDPSRRPAFTVTLDYCIAANPNSYNFSAGCATNWIASTTYGDSAVVPSGVYKVRVTVQSTITNLFGPAAKMSSTSETSGSAVAYIMGVCHPTTTSGKLWPFTAPDQEAFAFATGPNALYKLWDSQTGGSFKNVLDLTPAARWCDNNPNVNGNNDITFGTNTPIAANMPNQESTGTVTCKNPTTFNGSDTSWNRGAYAPDTRSCGAGGSTYGFTGNNDTTKDVQDWLAGYFQGTIGEKMWFPIFQGDKGNNYYGAIFDTGVACAGNNFFFSTNDGVDPSHINWGVYKDVIIYTFCDPSAHTTYCDTLGLPSGGSAYSGCWNKSSNKWQDCNNGGAPDRVVLAHRIPFRIYSGYPDGNGKSNVWGRAISPASLPSTSTCGGPNIEGNVVRLGQ